MARTPQTLELDGDISIECTPLAYERAEDLLPEMIGIGGLAFTHASGAVDALVGQLGAAQKLRTFDVGTLTSALGPLLFALSERMGAGKLKTLAPLILNGTAVVYPDESGKKVRRDLSSKADRVAAFDDHPELYFIALGYAAKVTFGRYFPAIGPLVNKVKSLVTMMKAPSHPATVSESQDFNQST